ncbi:hypothetical protein T10_12181 [Trichinella papuae]|uniref:Uncharacterized protein n=1 Tax=Trichinella papuae TaxID=268474 RepID=A0A0V1N7Z1_9BILA|nr:hypothetical protein T10_12181 [Trichinella papuae]
MQLCQPSRWMLIRTATPLPLEVLEQGFHLTDVPTFKISKPRTKPADLLKHSLAKVEEATLHPDVGKAALNGRDQGCFEITNKFRRIKLDAKFFRFGMQHFKYPAIRGQIFPYNSSNIRRFLIGCRSDAFHLSKKDFLSMVITKNFINQQQNLSKVTFSVEIKNPPWEKTVYSAVQSIT